MLLLTYLTPSFSQTSAASQYIVWLGNSSFAILTASLSALMLYAAWASVLNESAIAPLSTTTNAMRWWPMPLKEASV